MATMNVSLPDQMKDWIDGQVADGSYSTASDYVRDLIRRDRDYQTKLAALRIEIQKGLDSGVSSRTFAEIAADIRKRAEAKSAVA